MEKKLSETISNWSEKMGHFIEVEGLHQVLGTVQVPLENSSQLTQHDLAAKIGKSTIYNMELLVPAVEDVMTSLFQNNEATMGNTGREILSDALTYASNINDQICKSYSREELQQLNEANRLRIGHEINEAVSEMLASLNSGQQALRELGTLPEYQQYIANKQAVDLPTDILTTRDSFTKNLKGELSKELQEEVSNDRVKVSKIAHDIRAFAYREKPTPKELETFVRAKVTTFLAQELGALAKEATQLASAVTLRTQQTAQLKNALDNQPSIADVTKSVVEEVKNTTLNRFIGFSKLLNAIQEQATQDKQLEKVDERVSKKTLSGLEDVMHQFGATPEGGRSLQSVPVVESKESSRKI